MTVQPDICWPDKSLSLPKALSRSGQLFLYIFSFIVAVFGHPIWLPSLAIVTSCIGYALFWRALLARPSKTQRFWIALFWFATVQAIHLSWMTKDHYVGIYIFPVYLTLIFAMGVEFGLLSLCIPQTGALKFRRIFALSSLWVLLEWSRLWVMTGFSWNPLGMSLTWSPYPLQLAAILGVYGLTFWIIFSNLLALKLWLSSFRMELVAIFLVFSAFPYIFGYWHIHHEMGKSSKVEASQPFSALILQLGLKPETKIPLSESITPFSPLEQWEMIVDDLLPYSKERLDLIVMPEASVPYGTDIPLYTLNEVQQLLKKKGLKVEKSHLPPLVYPWASAYEQVHESGWIVGNRFVAQLLSNLFETDIIIGLEDVQRGNVLESYNAAFLLKPFSTQKIRYEKKVLVPMGEYIPFEWCKKILKNYGIEDSFTAGGVSSALQGSMLNYAVSICYEETFGHIIREGCQNECDLLVNLTNDVWYPHSQLPYMHFLHGRVRAVENGIPLLRSCNTGVTCAIDRFGRLIDFLPYENGVQEAKRDVLHVKFNPAKHKTIYSKFGDTPIIILSIFACIFGIEFFRNKKLSKD